MPEARNVRPWRVERYREGDEQAVLDLFRTVFGHSRSLEHWRWQFKDNPYGGPFVSLARREDDGTVVGSYSVMPVMLNVMGTAVLGCQSVDTAVPVEVYTATGFRLLNTFRPHRNASRCILPSGMSLVALRSRLTFHGP